MNKAILEATQEVSLQISIMAEHAWRKDSSHNDIQIAQLNIVLNTLIQEIGKWIRE